MNVQDFVDIMNTRSKITAGSRWTGNNGELFMVISLYEDENGNVWVYYRKESTGEEYSCWIDSFLQRFHYCMSAKC